MRSKIFHTVQRGVLGLVLLGLVAGCHKKEDTSAGAGAPAETTGSNTTAGTVASNDQNLDASQLFAAEDAALKARAYDRAVQALLDVQHQAQLTAQQQEQARARMLSLQANLANAAASGDANAIAAGQMLRAAAAHN